MSAEPRDPRRLHACRPAADDHHAARRGGGLEPPLVVAPDLGVDRAAGLLGVRDEVDARVAGHARADLVELAGQGLARPVRVGDQRAPDRDEVGLAFGERGLRDRRVVEAPDRDHGDVDRLADPLGEREQEAAREEHRPDRLVEGVPVARRDADRADAGGLEQAADRGGVLDLEAALGALGAADPVHDRVVGAAAGADRLDDLEREARAVLERPAVLVGAAVRERRDELAREVAVGAVDLDEVEARLLRDPGRERVVVDERVDLLAASARAAPASARRAGSATARSARRGASAGRGARAGSRRGSRTAGARRRAAAGRGRTPRRGAAARGRRRTRRARRGSPRS